MGRRNPYLKIKNAPVGAVEEMNVEIVALSEIGVNSLEEKET